ncbi:hypothetical protein [Desulfurobacterium atlanticum]|uniref:Uncharacterized protein n=1 Tax=Desulfurobacterium atlanticum TaxID=240169 RepID=A0A238Y6P0_9BACT|nr:hypothetical protein [Desulfurobacterium atlanticum]SNR66885.1 hypothetical protein SAMN06265340_102172 [Desulfurobacterium atlanticum]
MGYSLNSDISCGSKKFHVQTEFYSSSQKIVTNIFLNGNIIKRIEKAPETDNLEHEIKQQHNFVVEKLTTALKEKIACTQNTEKNEKGKFPLRENSNRESCFKPGKNLAEKLIKEKPGERAFKEIVKRKPGKKLVEKLVEKKPGKEIFEKIIEKHPGEETFKKTKKFLDTLFNMLKD